MKRISSNESFPRSIILSIDRNYDNLSKNTIAFKKYFFDALDAGEGPERAVEIATEKFRSLVEKRSSPSLETLREEGFKEKRESLKKRKEDILRTFLEKTENSDPELQKHLWKLFLQYRRDTPYDSVAIDRVLSFYERKLKPVVVPEVREYSDSELEGYYNLIGSMDPDNKYNNVQIFQRAIKKESAEEAIEKIKKIIVLRNYMRENGIATNSRNLSIFLNADGDYELAKRQIREREEEGRIGLDVGKLRETSNDDLLVNYNGERISLSRLVSYLYSDETVKIRKYAFKQLEDYIFFMGMSVDDAIARLNKVLRLIDFSSSLENMFPEDPASAKTILEGYYLEDDLSFEDALNATKKDLERD